MTINKKNTVQVFALQEIEKYDRCGVAISMGVGKTRIAIKHLIKNFDSFVKVLVVIPKLSVKDAWDNELVKMNLLELKDHISFTTYLSLNKRNPNDYDIVYLDECHNLLESHDFFLEKFNGKILGLTGTPPIQKQSEKYRMVYKYCPIVFNFSVDQATNQKILNDYKIYIHKLDLNKNKTFKKNKKDGGHWYTSEEDDYNYLTNKIGQANTSKQKQFFSIMRMRALMDYDTKETYLKTILKDVKDKCIVFANTQEQADRICKHSYHSNNIKSEENLQLFKDGRIQKLSSVMQLNEGITIPDLKIGIIMHAYGNERKTNQRIGRLLRLNPSETAICHILCYRNTIDEQWIERALENFDQDKITTINI